MSNNNDISKKKSKIAFLLLTYEDHIQANAIQSYLENGNIYVHPKDPTKVISYLKDHIINNLIETKWGDISIVKAELNLLKESFKNEENKWFILMSDTCYPLKTYTQIDNILNYKKNSNNRSSFSLTGYFNENGVNYYKSSQFWILNRKDTQTILENANKYIKIFNEGKYGVAAPDELFFLTLLMNEHNLDFKFNNVATTYSKWINLTYNKHPFLINKLTCVDKDIIMDNDSFFVRKITKSFIPIYDHNLKDTLTVLYIDEPCNNNGKNILNKTKKYINNNSNTDLIIFFSDNARKYMTDGLMSSSIMCINVIYKIYKESYILFKINNDKFLKQWKNIVFEEII